MGNAKSRSRTPPPSIRPSTTQRERSNSDVYVQKQPKVYPYHPIVLKEHHNFVPKYISDVTLAWNCSPERTVQGFLPNLPNEIIKEIAFNLPAKSVCLLKATCKKVHQALSSDPLLWRGLYYEYWVTVPFFEEEQPLSWEQLFALRMKATAALYLELTSNENPASPVMSFTSTDHQKLYKMLKPKLDDSATINFEMVKRDLSQFLSEIGMSDGFALNAVERECKQCGKYDRVHVAFLITSVCLARYMYGNSKTNRGKMQLELRELFTIENAKTNNLRRLLRKEEELILRRRRSSMSKIVRKKTVRKAGRSNSDVGGTRPMRTASF